MQICAFVDSVNPNDCPAWIQAWGSVLAIVASGLIATLQIRAANRSAQRVERDRKRAMAEAAAALARQFALQIASLQATLRDSAFYVPGRKRVATFDPFAPLQASIHSLSLHEMPDIESMRLLIGFRELVATSDVAFKRIVHMLEDPQQATQVKAEAVEHLVHAARHNDEKWAKFVEELPRR